jgi:hypothetical protein
MMLPLTVLTAAFAVFAFAQEPETPPSVDQAARFGVGARQPEPVIRPYEKVITSEAVTKKGIFTVHQIKDKLYYEIPKSAFDKDFLWVSTLAKTTLGAGYGGTSAGNRVVRWERRDRRVLLRNISHEVVADEKEPIARAVKASNHDTILMAFNIEAVNKIGDPVIEVTRLFTTEVTEFSVRRVLRARGFDSSRSFIETVSAFPENINVEATQTYTSPPETPGLPGAPSPPPPMFAMRQNTGTVVMHYSMVKLPEKPMMPRLYDERVGFFNLRQTDYGVDEHRAPERKYIIRWRLEKKDPGAAVSEPVKPIVYYVDPATPTKWVPYIKKGIEAWQPAFEEAGFRRAIIAKDAPSDPDWSPEDARVSVVRWLPSTIQNAMGPNVHDPRTGEILEADIQMFHNILQLQRDWYFAQVSPLDKRAQKLPLPDDLMGEMIAFVVAHEVGHTLGFPHNMKASSLYPFEKVRDKEWLKKMGHTPTLMDYSRFNYVAQPEDGIDPALLIPAIGPYDRFATMWGYKPVPGAKTPDQERAALNEWLKPQETQPWLRFSTARSLGSDPGENTEAVGDADPVKATALGTKNIQRVLDLMLTAVPQKDENFEDLGAVYQSVLGQWARELNHVATLVGGFYSQPKHGGQQGVVFSPVPKEKQREAVKFLNRSVFTTPTWAVRPEIIRRVEPTGALSRILSVQRGVLNNLLSVMRMARLQEQEAVDAEKAYAPAEFLADLRAGLFTELTTAAPRIDSYRRNLQRAYLSIIEERLHGRPSPQMVMNLGMSMSMVSTNPNDDTHALLRGELRSIDAMLSARQAVAADRITGLHMREMRDHIARILDPKFLPAQSTPSTPSSRPGLWPEELLTCWPALTLEP